MLVVFYDVKRMNIVDLVFFVNIFTLKPSELSDQNSVKILTKKK